ncbi:hypothetical protein COO59_19390 [Mixta theicola]|uniref:Bacterial CdiA-CT RNAse A domain-containing protein n=1 Tax=Mixta theicola TaxID=1458355 RepID=A0A2K1Q4X8_9GAMM|nr:RNase A-like domain-containing protein [Mixta theicola]PNS10084.1 hypothetical protein COO59_19390 [Mixta theicola]GLR10552.1 hypothetical protein GCM10007905_32720 [Mixta theicola]
MDTGLHFAVSPVQLAAVLSHHTITEAEMLSNRLLGGLELVLGTVELMGATALCLAPEPTMLTKAACVATGAHSLDSIHAAANRVLTGQDTRTATFRTAAALARQFGASEDTAWKIGLTVDVAVPSAAGVAWGISRIKYVRAGTLKLAEHEGIRKIGGHTLKKHIAKTDEELLARLAQSPGLDAATSFSSVQQAERYISAGLRANRLKIIHWANTALGEKALEFTWNAGTKVGYGFRQGSQSRWTVSHVRIVLKRQQFRDKPYFILTAYPELL